MQERGGDRLTLDSSISTTTRPERSTASFETFGLGKPLLRAVSDAGFQHPRPIQAATIPEALTGRDVLGLAQTGTGKTAAFALPILQRLASAQPGKGARAKHARALILAPTRELALQIHAEIQVLAKHTNITAVTVFGGVGASPQVRALRNRPDIVVACPGRLLDLMGSNDANMSDIEVLVLDEADHMLDMGFLPDIKRILGRLPKQRQNLLFSATMPKEIRSLTDQLLRKAHVAEMSITIPIDAIEHALYPVDAKNKTALLRHLLSAPDFKSAIVFLRTKHRAKRLAQGLDKVGHRAIALQGNMSQGQRVKAMLGFRNGEYDVLVATDIAARGIDVANVSHVINYDLPNTPDAYTHRIGRTGRSECTGKAYTFVTHEDFPALKVIERKLDMQIPRVKLRDFAGKDEAVDDGLARVRGPRGGGQRNGQARGRSGGTGGGRPGGGGRNGSARSMVGGRSKASRSSKRGAATRTSGAKPASKSGAAAGPTSKSRRLRGVGKPTRRGAGRI